MFADTMPLIFGGEFHEDTSPSLFELTIFVEDVQHTHTHNLGEFYGNIFME